LSRHARLSGPTSVGGITRPRSALPSKYRSNQGTLMSERDVINRLIRIESKLVRGFE
jgi:hypothetical protein